MKSSIRWSSRVAFAAALGLAQLVACSSDSPQPSSEEKRSGTLSLALEATAPSGTTYRLRNATFEIVDVRTGETVEFLFSEDFPASAREISTLLLTGNYTVRLFDGWFLERLGSVGTGGSGGMGSGGIGSGGFAGEGGFGSGGFAGDDGGGFAGAEGEDVEATGAGGEAPGSSGTGGSAPGSGGAAGKGGGSAGKGSGVGGSGTAGSSSGGTGIGGGSGGFGGGFGEIVEAQLVSDAVQFFSLFGGDEAFVNYQFFVGDEIIDFNRGRLNIGIGVTEGQGQCESPPGAVQTGRVLLETNLGALSSVSLFSALEAIATNGGRSDDPVLLYQQLIDSYATADEGQLPDAIHCGDETTDGVPTLNGYPIECNRVERFQFDNLFEFFPTAFVNRLDLAPENGAHCGQQRMIFANNAQNRMFIIIEAQIPNPAPELGILGCQPLAQFWLDNNAIGDPVVRGERLAQAFLTGAPELLDAGFGPFYTAENLTVGSGQIRTNQFDQDPWTLREFKLGLDGGELRVIPFPVAESPNGGLWNEFSGLPQGEACRENFLDALEGLLTDDPAAMSFVVANECKDAESRNDFSQDYASQLSDGFREVLGERLLGTGLSPDDIANRAQFAGSCIGCHEEAVGKFLGNEVFAPFSNGFVHVQEFAVECGNSDPGGICFQPSSGLRQVFLPSRLQVMGAVLGIDLTPDPCDGGGNGGSGSGGSGGGFPGSGGTFGGGGSTGGGIAGSFGTGGSIIIDDGGIGEPEPAPVVEIELPAADTSIEALQAEDAEIREAYGEKTLSGRSALSTH